MNVQWLQNVLFALYASSCLTQVQQDSASHVNLTNQSLGQSWPRLSGHTLPCQTTSGLHCSGKLLLLCFYNPAPNPELTGQSGSSTVRKQEDSDWTYLALLLSQSPTHWGLVPSPVFHIKFLRWFWFSRADRVIAAEDLKPADSGRDSDLYWTLVEIQKRTDALYSSFHALTKPFKETVDGPNQSSQTSATMTAEYQEILKNDRKDFCRERTCPSNISGLWIPCNTPLGIFWDFN